ncbi:D-alanine--D-alanine ligase [Striga asiatica]|uniref:D-alanine--D-alanine ligase n=1 Tax=Striga asiatica TaxID=4170 RepID=A0A5A7QDL1_STRAF|nr:D-alanine--D-alanine ligase [Striga asiatica]
MWESMASHSEKIESIFPFSSFFVQALGEFIYNQQFFTQNSIAVKGGGDEENHLGDDVYEPGPTVAAYHGIIGDDVCLRHSIEHLAGHIDLAEGCVFEDDIVVKENGVLIWERAHCGDESVERFYPIK